MAAVAQRIAPSDPSRGKQQAFARAMSRDGLESVVGTAGIKATLPAEDRAKQHLIGANAARQRALREAGSSNLRQVGNRSVRHDRACRKGG